MKIIVQKFGGTSVATTEARAAVVKKVNEAISNGYIPVVVVSAMGRKGAPYATDTLIGVLKEANPHVLPHELDLLMACGEIISSCVMAATLQANGIKAKALTGGQAGMVTDSNYGEAKIKNIRTGYLISLLEEGLVPVICGFQGETEDLSDITTLGRGGSDTSAAAFGAALNADLVEIYTDVDGVMTADPRIVGDAKIMKQISYAEICEMAHQGAKVIHPRAVEIAMAHNTPLVVKSTFSDAPGTLISGAVDNRVMEQDGTTSKHVASGVANLMGITLFSVTPSEGDASNGKKLLDTLASNGISIGAVSLQPNTISFAVYNPDAEKTNKVLKVQCYKYICTPECAKVSVVGNGMGGVPGVMATFVSALTGKNIQIMQTTDSNTTISAIIKQKDVNQAVNALHTAFKL